MRINALVFWLILVFLAPQAMFASFASTDVIVPASGRIEGSTLMFETTLQVENPSNTGSVGVLITLLRAGVNDPNPPTFVDNIPPGGSRDYVDVAQSLFGLPPSERAAVRVQAPIPLLVSTKLQASVPGEPVLGSSGFLFAAVPQTFAIGSGEIATLRELQLQQNIRYHLLASETTGAATAIRVRVKNQSSSIAGETVVSLDAFEQKLVPVQSIIGPSTISNGSIEVTVETGTGRVLVAGSLVTDQTQPLTGFDVSANGGGLTGVFGGAGLAGGGTSGNVTISVADNGITTPMLAPAAVTGAKIANGAVVRDINGKTDSVLIEAGTNITILNQANGLRISATSEALNGDVTGPATNNVVKKVGGVFAANIANAVFTVNEATSTNVPKAIVRRDSDGSAEAETLRVADGAPELPSFSFISDPNTGLLLRDTGLMVVAAKGTQFLGDLLFESSTRVLKDGQRFLHTSGTNSTFLGLRAGAVAGVVSDSTAVGASALSNLTSGSGNLALGANAGSQLSTGSNNIFIGHTGATSTENLTIRIGTGQTRAFMAGVRGITTGVANAIPVVVDSNGQLGTISSSRRYKFDVSDMGDTSAILRLRPVTFRYNVYGADSPLQYGLIAEEVAKVAPELVVFNEAGQPETVMYQFLTPILLNEVQKQRRAIDDLESRLARLEALLAQ